ncbi:MAG: hypothetical protein KKE02_01125 [Alphaproteobacteria bacterium]|nr:hypothetical protein [Alphaproteobacteria bacterium]MBU1515601.1 hypothetical protein [Alphaproteobacteria bacterium]MBU2096936.1 hypothetical protein [Alphaproteobacteria bacterium]MBU2149591.1 hypothetical protein [Alphaproteobacteria bacterium]MBU2305673.1 hypothetical protein [Alphaproteobacteria bacterium]
MRASIVIGAAAMIAAIGPLAHAQQPAADSPRLNLVCTGTDTMVVAMNPYYRTGRTSYSGGMVFGEGRSPAQLGVLVENGQVRVKPPKGSEPMFSKDANAGWYDLTDVAIDRLAIKGRLKWNRIDRSKLVIDRRNGQVTFGNFAGVCQQVSSAPDATKF